MSDIQLTFNITIPKDCIQSYFNGRVALARANNGDLSWLSQHLTNAMNIIETLVTSSTENYCFIPSDFTLTTIVPESIVPSSVDMVESVLRPLDTVASIVEDLCPSTENASDISCVLTNIFQILSTSEGKDIINNVMPQFKSMQSKMNPSDQICDETTNRTEPSCNETTNQTQTETSNNATENGVRSIDINDKVQFCTFNGGEVTEGTASIKDVFSSIFRF